MSTLSSYLSATSTGSDFTNSSYTTTNMPGVTIGDTYDWNLLYNLAQQILLDGNLNSTAVIEAVCGAWAGISGSGSGNRSDGAPTSTPSIEQIWNHAMTKTVGWTIVMVLKTVFLERKLDRWSGAHRFLNLGSTLVPFAMAAWAIYGATTTTTTTGEGLEGKTSLSTTATAMMVLQTLWKQFADTPMVRNWVLTGLASVLFHHLVLGRIRSSKAYLTIRWIPGILAGLFSLACWITDETTVAGLFLGEDIPAQTQTRTQTQPNNDTLLLYAALIRIAANVIAGWYCYAWMVSRIFGTNRCTSFPWFLLAVVAGKIATTGLVF